MEKKQAIYQFQAILIALILLIYSKSWSFEFTNWDDGMYVVNNPIIKNLSFAGIAKMFGSFYGGNYHPLTALGNAIEYHFFGLNPMVYHLVNVVLHALNSLLVFTCILLLWPNIWVAFGTALLFAVHPMHVESVAWVSERKDVLYTFFLLIAFCNYLRNKSFLVVLAAFIASCLSKPSAVIFPFLLILVDYYKNEEFDWKRSAFSKWPFFFFSFVFGIIALYAQKESGAVQDAEVQTNLILKIVAPCYSLVYYIFKFFIPSQFSAFHPFPKSLGFIHFACVHILVGIIWYLFQNRQNKKLIFASAFFLVNLLLVVQIIGFGNAIVAERYAYVPYIGLAFGICAYLESLAKEGNKPYYVLGVIIPASIILAFISFNRTKVWTNSITLFTDVTNKYPESAIGWNNLGNAQMKTGRPIEATASLSKAIQFNLNYAEAYNNRGAVNIKAGLYADAEKDILKAISLKQDYAEAYYNRGILYYQQGQAQNALEQFSKAIAIDKSHQSAYYNKAICLVRLNQKDEARAIAKMAVKLSPDDKEAKELLEKIDSNNISSIAAPTSNSGTNDVLNANQKGNDYMRAGNTQQAIVEYGKAIDLDNKYAEAYNNRGTAFGKTKDYNKAVADFTKAIELNKEYALAYKNRGTALSKLGKKQDACSDWEKASKLGNAKAQELMMKNCN